MFLNRSCFRSRFSERRSDSASLTALLCGIVLAAAVIGNGSAGNASAQIAARPIPPTGAPGTTAGTARHPKQEPCWQVAGVSRAALQERRSITQQARQEVEGVCANSSLSAQQRQQQIQQIHQQERQKLEGVITPSQQEAMRSCQAGRGHGGHMGGGGHGGHGGPCGVLSKGPHTGSNNGSQTGPPPHSPVVDEDEETPPGDAVKPN